MIADGHARVRYAWGFALTLVFSAVSMLLMTPKLHHVDMVESLKSNE